ncbi:FAD-dependent monooxygenase [Amycolatopsis jiangsuensis]|uniref:2-polyprenyl-6-methoxyphenol hydroxylase-like FAD-dependent oxidoreductase n=1 Tax=Amycolatopsis jiangsuensis TaxID=1181879 RepID=A0A840J4U4_9PSEU|nr:FAD-dependent monooxygenase [Amycolatopsis jiangsuensis]MBB4688749.1 2-polyprenyl-6-methoxyphenol hydroxylase-like FAD-dependent oxidoreductase [Amycolatopsis jiangsuensis]
MQPRRVAVLGGGPGGLYAARLLKLAFPASDIRVYEQGDPDTTFGFGVGLAAGTQRNLERADPDTLRDLVTAGARHDMTMQVGDQLVRVRNDHLVGVARTELLAILQRHAEKAGVQLEFGTRHTAGELDAELVIAADGVSSATREGGGFGTRIETGAGLYLWCGAGFALPDAVFAPVRTEFGTFVTHAYPYSGGRSTFLIETDERTWRRAGFDATTTALEQPGIPSGASDEISLRYLEKIFSEQLHGHPLIGNRTRWQRFRTVRCDRWSAGNVVLLGDAAHTAHFSIGSGTKLAMEDAIGLVDALREAPDAATAFARYERSRRPAVERMQELARRSQLWWESFPSRIGLPVERLIVAYMSRAGNVSLDRFARTSPDAVGTALRQYGGQPPEGDLVEWVLDRPLTHGGRVFPNRVTVPELERLHVDLRDPWSAEADALVGRGRAAGGVLVTGPPVREAVLTRLDVAERIRLETGALTAVEAPAGLRDDLAAGLVSGRTDLVRMTEEVA